MPGNDVQSGRWYREGRTLILPAVEPSSFAFAEPAPALLDEILGEVKAAPAPVRVDHFHIRKAPNAAGVLVPASTATVMTPAAMKPGYVLPTQSQRQALQRALTTLVRGKYATAVSPAVNLRIALVDLTGAKRNAPVFAGFFAWGSGTAFEGGSLTKILALYAVYQLRFDLDTCAALLGIKKASDLQARIKAAWAKRGLRSPPNLTALFSFVEATGKTVTARLRKIHDIHHNHVARELIRNLGFEYIGSAALQSGLFDETQGGLWLNAAYNDPPITWTTSPFPKLERHNATALAAATYFTLLAQGRLVNQATSTEIGDVLAKRVCMSSGVVQGIKQRPGVQGKPANKCGILPPFFHEAFHLIRQVPGGKRLEYAAAVLSKEPPTVDFTILGRALDQLIVSANP